MPKGLREVYLEAVGRTINLLKTPYWFGEPGISVLLLFELYS